MDRSYTSSYRRVRPDHMGRRSGKKSVIRKKTYDFVKDILEHLWAVAGDNRPVDSDIEYEPDSDGNSTDESDGEHNNHSS